MSLSGEYADGWSHIRDHAKPVTLYDRDRLDEAREFTKPSKAHVKRLKRRRAEVVIAKPEVPKVATTAQRQYNELMRMRDETRALLKVEALKHLRE